MKRIIALIGLAVILFACSKPATSTPTPPPAVTAAPPTLTAPIVAAPAFTALHMVDVMNGWAITDTGVVRTNDGGTTWHAVTPPGVTKLGFGTTFYFLDASHGWVVTGDPSSNTNTLYRTQDGGTTWQSSMVNFFMGHLVFLNASNGWMMSDLGAGAGSDAVAIFQTTDGGQTWNQTYIDDPTQPGASSTLPLGGLKDGITATDMKTAWVGGITYASGVIYLYQTQDGGQSWKLQSVQIPSGYDQAQFETTGPQFVTAQDAYMPVHTTNQYGTVMAVYYSHDGGSNWALTPTMIPNGGSLNFVSAADGFVWNGTEFYVTHDGAKSWTTVSPGIAFGDSFSGMDFLNTTTGFVLTDDTRTIVLYKTTDGGSTWAVLSKANVSQ
ncbi:MAG TPA: YCF48-related protein [Anaerolineales bacterium]|nr:YCF48-related protein [Anaerolineales bacterium]